MDTNTPLAFLFIVIVIIGIVQYYNNRKKKPFFVLISIDTEILSTSFFHHLNQIKDMKHLKFAGPAAAGKSLTATFQLNSNTDGSFAALKEGTLKGTSSDESIATVEAAVVDAATGKYSLKITYTGALGTVTSTLSASPDLDNSGDADISVSIDTTISEAEASGWNEEATEISDLA